jgi:hypothetical protein
MSGVTGRSPAHDMVFGADESVGQISSAADRTFRIPSSVTSASNPVFSIVLPPMVPSPRGTT